MQFNEIELKVGVNKVENGFVFHGVSVTSALILMD